MTGKKEKKNAVKKTFVCDDSVIVTIPLTVGRRGGGHAQRLMPDAFHCVFRDVYKVFAINGRPKPLGAAQAFVGLLVLALGLLVALWARVGDVGVASCLLSPVFVLSGVLSYAAGHFPNIHVVKLSFSLNIFSFFCSAAAAVVGGVVAVPAVALPVHRGVSALIVALLLVENLIALFLVYWLSKAVCRTHFNTLPTIILKQTD